MCRRIAFNECPCCGGERVVETGNYRIDYFDGSVSYEEVTCRECNGTGEVEEPVELIDENDLDEMAASEEQSLDYFNRYIAGER